MVSGIECVAQCVGGSNTVSIRPPNTPPVSHISPFDIRGIGALNLTEMESGSTFEDAFGGEDGFLSNRALADVARESETVYRLGWDLADGNARRTIWFDSGVGYSPIRLEDSQFGDLRRHKAPANVVEVSWQADSDAFVPVALRLERYSGIGNGQTSAEFSTLYSYQIVWESVNRELPAELFDPEKLVDDVPKAMFVVDHRLGGQPILVKRTDRDNNGGKLPSSANSSWPTVFVVLNVGIIVLAVAVLMIRARRKKA